RRRRRRRSRPRRPRRGVTFRPVVITFLTDFGLQDDFVGTCHGVIATIAPDARVIDITHGIRPGHVLQGAIVLANTLPYMPPGVHLAVVDPGVGSGRRALALRDEEGRVHVGPDNGLLLPAAERFGNLALNLRRDQLEHLDLGAGTRVELTSRGERFFAVSARTFADAPRGSLILYEDSYGSLALAVSRGSAAQLLRVEEGGEIVLDLAAR